MASLDRRLNPLYAIKECSSCGTLYTRDCGCSKGGLEDKILVPIPDLSRRPLKIEKICLNCETLHGPIFSTMCSNTKANWRKLSRLSRHFQVIDDDTKTLIIRSHSFVKSMPVLVVIRCFILDYKIAPKAPIISNPEPCNQTIDELPQTLPSFDTTCYQKKKFNHLRSKPNFVDDSPNVFNPPPQPPIYSCEFCGNDARYGHYCTPQVPFIYPEPCYNQGFNFPQDFHDFQQQYLCCENCGGPHEAFQCQPLNYYEPNPCYDSNYSGYDQFDNSHPQQFLCCENCGGPHEIYQCQPLDEDYYHEQNPCYDSNSFGFDQFQPPQYTVNHPIFNAQNSFLNSQNKLMEQMTSMLISVGQLIQKKEEEKRIEEEQAAKARYWKILVCYDDDDDEERSIPLKDTIISGLPSCVAITPALSTKEPVDSLIMENEHLDTISETKSDEFIKSSVENLVQNPSEFEDFSDIGSECDGPVFDDSTTFSNSLFDVDDDFSSSDDESFSDEDVPNEIYSNPLFDEEIISVKIDASINSMIDSLVEQFSG
ncbi:hypothetical protein Tco_0840705 [Tanacetum coccineum]|uniref:Uncharacterized protein n=1 Tax=Tanacetum coccineum TaxID=301880 RepID=A0ABQ5AY86_9ASTR